MVDVTEESVPKKLASQEIIMHLKSYKKLCYVNIIGIFTILMANLLIKNGAIVVGGGLAFVNVFGFRKAFLEIKRLSDKYHLDIKQQLFNFNKMFESNK